MCAHSKATSMFKWITRDESQILANANNTKVATRNPISTKEAPLVKTVAAVCRKKVPKIIDRKMAHYGKVLQCTYKVFRDPCNF